MRNIFLLTVLLLTLGLFAHAGTDRVLDGHTILNNGQVIGLPTGPDTLVGESTAQTLTNKTIDGASNTFTNIPASSVSLSAYLKADGTTSLTGNLVPLTNNTIELGSVATNKYFNQAGITTLFSDSIFPAFSGVGILWDATNNESIKWSTRKLQVGSTIKLDWSGSDVSLNTHKLTGVVDPTADQDAATKHYVDSSITAAVGSSGTVTSVGLVAPSFLSVSGSPVTTSGSLTLSFSGTALPIANGGTGFTTANGALNALLPSQLGMSARHLVSDGTDTSWEVFVNAMPLVTAPQVMVETDSVAFDGTANNAKVVTKISGNGGNVVSIADPQIEAGLVPGQELVLIGTDSAATFTLNNGTGLALNGPVTLGQFNVITLIWDGDIWIEESRQ